MVISTSSPGIPKITAILNNDRNEATHFNFFIITVRSPSYAYLLCRICGILYRLKTLNRVRTWSTLNVVIGYKVFNRLNNQFLFLRVYVVCDITLLTVPAAATSFEEFDTTKTSILYAFPDSRPSIIAVVSLAPTDLSIDKHRSHPGINRSHAVNFCSSTRRTNSS